MSETQGTRLNKYIANAGVCSRRQADVLIKEGQITVNDITITEMGHKVQEGDKVKHKGKVLQGERFRYILLNKPKGFITTLDDPQGRRTVMELVENACTERIYPVGRLDRNTSGLLLFTNDGELTKRLTHPSFEVKKIYQAELDKTLTSEHFSMIQEGVELDDGLIKVDDIAYTTNKRTIGLEIHSGKNRIVRRIFEHYNYEVSKLDRVGFASLTKKDLPRGRWRNLMAKEIAFLKMK